MKVIHTADWHIGKMLYKHDINEELELFFDWLIQYIAHEKVNLLLVSGDIFDLANPSNKDLKIYYKFLRRLMDYDIQVVITGGNHDSVSMLNAPREILSTLNIHIVGGATDDISEEIVPIMSHEDNVEAIVLAVPFLRDRDLRVSVQADMDVNKDSVLPFAIQKHYNTLVQITRDTYGIKVPIIAMGHLFVQGATTSESERDIHVGNLLGIQQEIFHPDLQYVALGHIHKPQRISRRDNMRYSGSPVYLDFSEVGVEKNIVVFEIIQGQIQNIQTEKVPMFRALLRITGSLENIIVELKSFKNTNVLPAFVELIIEIEQYDPMTLLAIENFVHDKNNDYKIIKHIIKVKNKETSSYDNFQQSLNIEDHKPIQILEKRLEKENLEESDVEAMKEVYSDIVMQIQREE